MSFNYDTLTRYVGNTLSFSDTNGTIIPLIIDKVVKGKLNDDQWTSFSVFYKSDGSFQLTQGHYQLDHEELGKSQIFIVPRDISYYETIISRRRVTKKEADAV